MIVEMLANVNLETDINLCRKNGLYFIIFILIILYE